MLCMLHRHVGLSRPFYVNKIYSFIHYIGYITEKIRLGSMPQSDSALRIFYKVMKVKSVFLHFSYLIGLSLST